MLKRLSCKEVAHLANDYLDHHISGRLNWKIRLHLLACNCCRQFVQHLKISKQVVPQLIERSTSDTEAERILLHIKEALTKSRG